MRAEVFIICGVSGCGKSTVGRLLAEQLGGVFHDGDDFHPPANVDKMAGGIPLTDEDRQGWLARLRRLIEEGSERPMVIACSALKKEYRDFLQGADSGVKMVFLEGSMELIGQRLQEREVEGEHFMPASLLASQFAILERPEDALVCAVEESPEDIVRKIIEA